MITKTRTYFVTLPNFGRVFEITTDKPMTDREVLDLYAQDAGYADYATIEREEAEEAETPGYCKNDDNIPTVDFEFEEV